MRGLSDPSETPDMSNSAQTLKRSVETFAATRLLLSADGAARLPAWAVRPRKEVKPILREA